MSDQENDAIAGLLSELVRAQSIAAEASRAAEQAARDAEAAALKQAAAEDRRRQEVEKARLATERHNRNLEDIISRYVGLAEQVKVLLDEQRVQNTVQLPGQIASVLQEWFEDVSEQLEMILDPDRPRLHHYRLDSLVDGVKLDPASINSIRRRIGSLRKYLDNLLIKKAEYGIDVPAFVLTPLEKTEQEIAGLMQILEAE